MSEDVGQTLFNIESLPAIRELSLSYKGEIFTVGQSSAPFIIGRDESCDLSVDSQFASRQHCRLLYQNKNFVIEDSSTNGTYIRIAMGQPSQLNKSLIAITGNGMLKLGEAMAVGDKNVIQFKAVY
jgi:pSer/pThr/pTyr-binding forkhead associated (FHA) protein